MGEKTGTPAERAPNNSHIRACVRAQKSLFSLVVPNFSGSLSFSQNQLSFHPDLTPYDSAVKVFSVLTKKKRNVETNLFIGSLGRGVFAER